MALNPEELKRQRKLRNEQRARQAAQRRSLLIRLGIAAAVLLACGILIVVLVIAGRPASPENPETSTAAPTQTTPSVPSSPVSTVHLAVAGDLNITDNVVEAGGKNYDYTESFLDVAHLLSNADITALNFDGNLCGTPYGTTSKSAPPELMQALNQCGVDLIQLANSYSINHGLSGLSATINTVRSAGMEPLGVYENQSQFSAGKGFTLTEVNGIKIAFVAFTKGMDGMTLPAGSENCVNVLYSDYDSTYQKVDTAGISAILDNVAAAKPDITVAMLHWGSEFNNTISSTQKSIISLLQSKGVDAIIGTHSHYVQQMSLNPDTGAFVAYSLGDFFGDAQRAGSEYSVILDLEITKNNETGEAKITNFTYTPIFTVAESGSTLRVVRIHEAMAAYEAHYISSVSEQTYNDMAYALERIEARIAGE